MQRYLPILRKCALFHNMSDNDILNIIHCMDITSRTFQADSYLFFLNDTVNSVGIILEGEVEIVKETITGGRHILSILSDSDIFCEGIVCTSTRISPVTARTRTAATICFIPFERILKTCSNSCDFHTHLIHNMMLILGEKNLFLNHKIDLLTLKGMREKLATYLLTFSKQVNSNQFNLPFNRNELAEFLNVSRTSMCRELGRMKEECLIDYHLNRIKILDMDALIDCLED